MNKYKFLGKPLFFIFSLLFSTWLVIRIEKVSPSDLGMDNSLSKEENAGNISTSAVDIRKICYEYKTGSIDSLEFEKKLEKCLQLVPKTANKYVKGSVGRGDSSPTHE